MDAGAADAPTAAQRSLGRGNLFRNENCISWDRRLGCPKAGKMPALTPYSLAFRQPPLPPLPQAYRAIVRVFSVCVRWSFL